MTTPTTDPLVVDVTVRDHDWTVTVRLGDNAPEQLAEDICAQLHPHSAEDYDRLLAAIRKAVIRLTPDEACDAGEALTRAGTHPGECTVHHCRRLHFNAGLCRSHWLEQQDAVDARLAAQGFAVGGRTA